MRLPSFFTADPPPLTRGRIGAAYAVALGTDALQFLLGPLGWAGADEVLDVMATALLWLTLGFHPMFLPTFVIEFLPISDVLPTWTACVALVIGLRKRQHAAPPPPSKGPVIDV